MSGFSGILTFEASYNDKLTTFAFPEYLNKSYKKKKELKESRFRICHYSNDKFSDDKYLTDNGDSIVGFDGVMLQGNKVINCKSNSRIIESVANIKGSFTAVTYDKNKGELFLFADQTSSRQFFRYSDKNITAFSSSIFLLADILRHFGVEISISTQASYMLLSLGYLLEDYTLVKQIKKIKAGELFKVVNGKIHSSKYHDYFSESNHVKISSSLFAELDRRLETSLELEYSKDICYNYEHLATLSGGLDSRMNVMLAHSLDFKDISALTFSEGFMSDELIARDITSDLRLKHIILLLNNGFQLYDIKTPLILNNCAVYYFGAAQTHAAVSRLEFGRYGLLHNGALAESSKGGYLGAPRHEEPSLRKRYAISGKLFDKLDLEMLEEIFSSYPNDEMFVTYNRGFNAIHNGSWMTLPYTDTTYTFMDTDFARLAYSIDPVLRFDGRFTVKWLQHSHPRLTQYPWKYGIKPTNSKAKLTIGRVTNKIKKELFGNREISVPIDDWYKEAELRAFVKKEYERSRAWQIIPSELSASIVELFDSGTPTEKFLCISYLSSIELIFCESV